MDGQIAITPQPGLTVRALLRLALAAMILATGAAAAAPSAEPLSLVDLIGHSDRILRGTVTRVAGGRTDDGVAYTEVTLLVAESILGPGAEQYTFRQLAEPSGLPTWTAGEKVVLFLDRPAARGLQTTVGLRQGKLCLSDGELSSPSDHEALFADIVVDASGLSLDQVVMLEGGTDAVDAEAFLDLVRRAVGEDWIARGLMRRGTKAQ